MNKKVIYQELLKEEAELSEALEKVRGLRKYYEEAFGFGDEPQKKIEFKEPEHNSIAEKKGYDQSWIFDDKAIYILKLMGGQGMTSQHAEKWVTVDTSLSLKRAKYLSRKHLSKLFNDGRIGATRVGSKNRYYIKE